MMRGKEPVQVSEERRGRAMTDPTELWRQWFETGTKMWANVFEASRDNYMDPYGLYRQWFNGLEDLQQQMLGSMGISSASRDGDPASTRGNNPASLVSPAAAANPAAAQSPAVDAAKGQVAEAQNLWKQWFEAAAESWQKTLGLGQEAVELTPRWIAMWDQIRNNFMSAEGYPTDPLQFATRWYNATSGPLSDFVGDLIEREDILDVSSQFLQSYASFYKVFRRNSEEYLKSLQIPVRSDITRVAGLVVALEDKIDLLDEAFEDFEYGYAKPATAESLEAVEERIGKLEDALERIEGGAAENATADSVSGLERRLDGVEGKIDQLIAAFENASQNGAQNGAQVEASQTETSQPDESEVRATAAARRKAEELNVDLSEVTGTGADGQITVDDVRRQDAQERGES
jgi:exonuclease VII small subunit